MRAKRARLALAFAVLVTPFLLLTPANAHATITSSSPPDGSRLAAAPASVSITFDEPVTLVYLHVVDAHGRRVDDGADTRDGATIGVGLRTGLGQGTFVESYRVISADSHPVAGSIRFVVGNGALDAGGVDLSTTNAWTSGLFVAVRWIGFAGLAVVGGAWLLITGWPQGRRETRARRLLWAGWGALSAAAAAELLLQGPYAAGETPGHLLDWSLLQQTLHTPYGVWHSVRLILLGVLARVAGPAAGRPGRGRGRVLRAGPGRAAQLLGHRPRPHHRPGLAVDQRGRAAPGRDGDVGRRPGPAARRRCCGVIPTNAARR